VSFLDRGSVILAALLLESVALALAGSAAGIALALCTPLLDFNTENFATGQEIAFHFTPNPGALLLSVGIAIAVDGLEHAPLVASCGSPTRGATSSAMIGPVTS
jgi:hypothetical protein